MAEATNKIRHDPQLPSVERILAVVRDENKRMHEEVRTLRNELRELTSAVATQSAYMQQYMKQKFMPQNPPSKAVTKFEFPIQTESDLADFENSITDENREDCVAQIRSKIFRVGSLASSLTNILSEQILLEYNVDGMSGRKRLRHYVNFFNALLEAIKLNDSSEPATKQLANAISKVKTRVRYKDKLGKSLTSSEVVYLDSSPFDGSCDDADTMPSMEDDEDFHEDKLIANSEDEYLITELVDESKLNLKDIEFPIESYEDLEKLDNEIANGKQNEYMSQIL
nr:uncharacterized protein LOC108129575 [Drosophila bipectinata]